MKDAAQAHPRASGDSADAVAHDDAVRAPGAGNWPFARSEHHSGALRDRHCVPTRLRAWTLLEQQELAAGVIDSGAAQDEHDLQRKRELAVDVLMQTVVAAGVVRQQQRRW